MVDIAIVAILLVSPGVGLLRGFIREVLSLAAWVVALWGAYQYAQAGAIWLISYIAPQPLRVMVAFALIFVIVLIAASFLGYLISRMLPISGISGVDRSLGMLFGVGRGILIVSLLMLAATFMDLTTQPWWQESMLIHYFLPVADELRALMPADLAVYFLPGGGAG